MPLQATSGAASYDAFGGGVAAVPNYIEDVFSTWLYTGNNSTQTITNGINLSGNGGLVWLKRRNAGTSHVLSDSARGLGSSVYRQLFTDSAAAQNTTTTEGISSFSSSGFTLTTGSDVNALNNPYVSWTFREQPKFFDCVTYTGNGTSGRQIPHSLGSVPGCIIVKRTDVANNWFVYHRSLGSTQAIYLDATNASANDGSWANTDPTSTVFTVAGGGNTNGSGNTYVAYLFAHDAGGFGLTGTDNVISCGSYVGNGSASGQTVTLGYEPQFLIVKPAIGLTGDWQMYDVMRGMSFTNDSYLAANSSAAEFELGASYYAPLPTGFQVNTASNINNKSGTTYIYIAIRRGPMKVPTTGTSVYDASLYTGDNTTRVITAPFVTDLAIVKRRSSTAGATWADRLRGRPALDSSNTAAEVSADSLFPANPWDLQGGVRVGSGSNATNSTGSTYVDWNFRRAPGFMDVCCYTGTGSARTVAHNLAAVPELMIVKQRSAADFNWVVYSASLGAGAFLELNTTAASVAFGGIWNSTTPTSTVFSLGTSGAGNASAVTYVAYLFATCPGVSKVGSFTGTGATQVINCGFTGGARFVLIKSTSTTGSWYVWDSARGIVAGNDPYLLLNSTAAEVTNTDWVDTAATGFELSNAGGNLANSSGVSYVFLAVA